MPAAKERAKGVPLATFMAVLLGVVVCVCPRCLRASSEGRWKLHFPRVIGAGLGGASPGGGALAAAEVVAARS